MGSDRIKAAASKGGLGQLRSSSSRSGAQPLSVVVLHPRAITLEDLDV